jgi:PAS domain S-box-containing protein
MISAPLAQEEGARLAALHALELLDTGPDLRFDRIVRLLARLLDAPIALLNLVDVDRQWSKAAVGLPQGGQADRSASFCAHVVAQGAPLLVPDTLADERFHDNPQVTHAPGLRCYFGVPVRSPDGPVIGSLCVASSVPRHLGDHGMRTLEDLAAWVEAELDRDLLARTSLHERVGRQQLEAITTAVSDAIVVVGTDGRVRAANPAASTLSGLTRQELLGRHVGAMLVADPVATGALERVLAAGPRGAAGRGEVLVRRPRGGPLPVEVTFTGSEGVDAYVVVARDISERRRFDALRDGLVATVSHELRTPLSAIKASLDLAVGGMFGPLDPTLQEVLDIAQDSTDRLCRLVDDIVDLERTRNGQLRLNLADTEVAALIERSVRGLASLAASSGVHVEVAALPSAPVRVDADRIVQALTNLLANAVRFSPPGEAVEVSASTTDDEVIIEVRDRGPGVPETERHAIFGRFHRVDDRGEGAGLGLAIARELVERQHGSVWLGERIPGEPGARFHLRLPLAAARSSG